MAQRGGIRPGQGRPSKHDEDRVRNISLAACIKIHGTEQKAFEFLFTHEEPSLIKFAFEHAFGKPREKRDIDATVQGVNLSVIMPDGH